MTLELRPLELLLYGRLVPHLLIQISTKTTETWILGFFSYLYWNVAALTRIKESTLFFLRLVPQCFPFSAIKKIAVEFEDVCIKARRRSWPGFLFTLQGQVWLLFPLFASMTTTLSACQTKLRENELRGPQRGKQQLGNSSLETEKKKNIKDLRNDRNEL